MSGQKKPSLTSSISISTQITENDGNTLLKNYRWWSLLGIAFSLTNSWLGVSSSLVVGLYSGGPVLIVYGLIIAVFFTLMCGYTLSEFASALPNSSGSSFWVLKLLERNETADDTTTVKQTGDASDKEEEQKIITSQQDSLERPIPISHIRVSLTVGLINYFGAIFTTSSICSSLGYSILGCYSLFHPNYESKRWHVFIIYECLNVIIGSLNCWAEILPILSQAGLFSSLITYCLTFIVSLACRSFRKEPWPSTAYIFKDFKSTSGWSSSGMSFIVGLVNPLWAFAGIDSATHMVDEVGHVAAVTLVPKAIMGTIIIGFITSFTYAIGMFYCITDSDSVISAILPIIEIYYQATGNKGLAVFLQSCCIITGLFCGIASGTWQSRIIWSIGKDYNTIIGSSFGDKKGRTIQRLFGRLALIHPFLRVPHWSVFISHLFVAIIGCVLVGSTTAFNAIITACICLLLISYAIPTVILLCKGKRKFYERIALEVPLSCTKKIHCGILSCIPNVLTVCWCIFCLIFLSFPYELPVSSTNMNYVSAAYGGVGCVVAIIVLYIF